MRHVLRRRYDRWFAVTRRAVTTSAVVIVAGCGRVDRSVATTGAAATAHPPARRTVSTQPAPPAEFLLVAGDSTFWVTSGSRGIRVRGAPLTLARYDGRFYEVYVTDIDRSFYDAVFAGQRIYRRDLLSGDSAAVFEDTTVIRAASGYADRHPDDRPLESDEDGAEEPASTLTGEVDIVDVHGPFVSFEYHESRGGSAGSGELVRYGVVDMRTRRSAPIAAIAGASDAPRILRAGRDALGAVRDSVRAADTAGAGDAVHEAARALHDGVFAFDPGSFTLVDSSRMLGIVFAVPGRGGRGSGKSLTLPPIRVHHPTEWWAEVMPTLPSPIARGAAPAGSTPGASVTEQWRHGPTEVLARYDTIADDPGVELVLRDSTQREWAIGRVPGPTQRLFWLDASAPDTSERAALHRAFDESALYADDARGVRLLARPHRAVPRLVSAPRTRGGPRLAGRPRRPDRAARRRRA